MNFSSEANLMKPLTTSQTIGAFAFFLVALLFAGHRAVEDEQVNEEYVASIIRDSTEQALVVQSKDEWVALVDQGDEMLSLKEVK